MMNGWLGGKAGLSVEEINTLFRRLAIPAVKSACPQSYGSNLKPPPVVSTEVHAYSRLQASTVCRNLD